MRVLLLASVLWSMISSASEPAPIQDQDQTYRENRRLVAEFGIGTGVTAGTIGLALAGCALTQTPTGGCSSVFPGIATAAVFLLPPLTVNVVAHHSGNDGSLGLAFLGDFVGTTALIPLVFLLAEPGFKRGPAPWSIVMMGMTMLPTAGAMAGYELTIHPLNVALVPSVQPLKDGALASVALTF